MHRPNESRSVNTACPSALFYPRNIVTGPDLALWFSAGDCNSDNAGIARITVAGALRLYNVPTPSSCPSNIVAGPDGAMWFSEGHVGPSNIGRITTTGAITEFPVPDNTVPSGITTGPDGALWFVEHGPNSIGRMTTAGAVTSYPVTGVSELYQIVAGPDGALWFPGYNTNQIARMTTAGAVTAYPIPAANSSPLGIAVGPDGALWFSETSQVGRVTTAGAITEYPAPGPGGGPGAITTGPDGNLWFTQTLSIGQAVFETANLSVNPSEGYYRSSLNFMGSGYEPNALVQIYKDGVGSGVLASATADTNGSFTVTGFAPESQYGPRIFLGAGGGKLGAAAFLMAPSLILSPASGAPGSTTTAAGYGFGSFETVDVYWDNPRTSLGKAFADIHGSFSGSAAFAFTVPSSAPVGLHEIPGRGTVSGAAGFGFFNVQ